MGLSRAAAHFLIETVEELGVKGRVLTLGRQNLGFNIDDLPARIAQKLQGEILTDTAFFKALGFTSVMALDFSDYEGAELIGDLNACGLNVDEQFDLVVDTGTLEHIFHIPNALANIYDLLDVNGRVIHVLPASNRLEHGFYMFSPTLFWDYYQANEFVIEKSFLMRNYYYKGHMLWELYSMFPGELDWLSMGKLNGDSYSNIFVTQKQAESTNARVPNQRRARNFWQAGDDVVRKARKVNRFSDCNSKIWLVGYNRVSELLAGFLSLNGFNVEGFIDSFKFGYRTRFGVIKSPEMVDTQDGSSFVFCMRNASLINRNDALAYKLASQMSLSCYWVDEQLFDEPALVKGYTELLNQAQELKVDEYLNLPYYKTY